MDELNMYKEYILQLYDDPLNKGELNEPDVVRRELNPTCGDDVTLMWKYDDNKVDEVSHLGHGCAISQAAVSMLTEEMKGKSREELEKISQDEMIEMLGIPISHTRYKCALIGLKALQEGLKSEKK